MACILKKSAPRFAGTAVIDGRFQTVSLSDYEEKYVVLFFYPMDFSKVCPTEIQEFSKRIDEFHSVGCEVVAVSCDSQFTHLAWTSKSVKDGGLGPVNIPLLSDKSGRTARDYGVYNAETGTSDRALFIIDKQQVVQQILVNDRPVARSVDETLRLVQAMKFSDEDRKDETQTESKRGIKRPVPDDASDAIHKLSKMEDVPASAL